MHSSLQLVHVCNCRQIVLIKLDLLPYNIWITETRAKYCLEFTAALQGGHLSGKVK